MFIILDECEQEILLLRRRLYRHFIHSIVVSPQEIEKISLYPAHAILIPRPVKLTDPGDTCTRLREVYPHLPLAMIYQPDSGNYYRYAKMVDVLLQERITTQKMAALLYEDYRKKNGKSPDSRIVDCLRTDSRVHGVVYLLAHPFPAHKTPWMLARYLTLAAPRAVPAEELLKTCFPPQGQRNPRVIRRHLSELDRMFEIGFGIRMFACKRPAAYYISRQNCE